MRTKKKPFLIAIISIIIFFLLITGGFAIVRAVGKAHLQNKADIPPEPVRYQDKLYEYNENILTFLVMGIDNGKETFEPWEAEIESIGNGQADALFLAVLNREDHTINVIGSNRKTMTDSYAWDATEGTIPTFVSQIALQHAYGADEKVGCEYQQKVVQKLFYNLPIHGYAAIDVAAVPDINDMIGGVDVEVLEDLTSHDAGLVEGNQVHLMGESAYWYVKYRDINQFASVDMRTKRQAQYLNGFIDAAKQSVKENPLVALQLYEELMPQMDTDISTTEAVYLASLLPRYHFDENSFYRIPGETVMGETYEEFYPDEDALLSLILDIFYKEVNET
ncbi:MAG: LCP family protein [Lachnospiraceae bacterium]|nr:LCP family protein [Lachnospiraceae bacterium]